MVKKVLSFAAFAFICLAVSAVHAGLIYDMRVAAVQPAGVIRVDDTHANITSVGQVVMMEIYAVLKTADGTAADPLTSGVLGAQLSVLKGSAGLKGNLSGQIATDFSGAFSSGGTPIDLNGDSSLDLGNNGLASSATGFIRGSSTAGGGTSIVKGNNILLGTVAMTVTGLGEPTTVYARPRAVTSGTAASKNVHNFTINGTGYLKGAATGTDPNTIVIPDVAGGSVCTIQVVPEPSTFVLLGMGALALLAIRRRK